MAGVDDLVAGLDVPEDACVIVPTLHPIAMPFHEVTDEQFDRMWEQPMRDTIVQMVEAHRRGVRRIVVVTPTTGMSGGDHYVATAATAEAVRVLVKSAARQWGADGITVNAVAVAPHLFDVDESVAGEVALAPAALADGGDPAAVIAFLVSPAAAGVTGITVTADGGVWMSP